MSYKDIPSIDKPLYRKVGLTITGFSTIKGCCLNDLAIVRPQIIGQRLSCNKCGNILTAKEAELNIFENQDEAVLPGKLKTLAKGIVVHLIQYTKPFWSISVIDNDLLNKNITKNFVSETTQHITVVETPCDWLEKGSIHVFTVQQGVTVVVGKIKEACKDKLATVKALSKNINSNYPRI